ncbi:VOC family protein [Spirosoma sp. BT702]|uniref:VOC family protein n=1 Tax=Spirosoma profusum TaxID=2771354 RepID=A0A927ATY4_9BACT|nr:VOC family protein [Spirosoma profusum]MBD2701472.1 VOC family protein [Spirosoma profusum]
MDQRLSVITLGTDNLAAMKSFYSEKLGWQTEAENKDIVFYKMNGFLFSLFDRNSLATGAGVSATGNGFRSLTLSCNVNSKEEVDVLFKELNAKEVKILNEPQDTPFGGYFFCFADVEDNVLEVAYNPYIPMDERGNVITHKNIDNL